MVAAGKLAKVGIVQGLAVGIIFGGLHFFASTFGLSCIYVLVVV